ncbi:MAG: 2Fe-2S iron-sulfur cluster-binding protein [Spirochaetia bacterium]|jgi:ferredoxin|nr:2Fe-2S iron-sulfur cluster-binding protein [Spirochaetia bacterium]
MPIIKITNTGQSINASSAISILNILLREGIRINHFCGGKAVCGTCGITIVQGMENLSAVSGKERGRLDAIKAKSNQRLACQTYVKGDVEIKIPGYKPEKPV